MSDPESGYKWWIRYAIVPLVGGGGVVALLVAYYLNRPPHPPRDAAVAADAADSASAERERRFALKDVQEVVNLWAGSLLGGNVDKAMEVSGDPFFIGKTLVHGNEQLRERYVERAKKAQPEHIHLQILQVRALADPSARNVLDDADLRGLRLSSDDFAATTQLSTGMRWTVLVRRSGGRYEVIGFN